MYFFTPKITRIFQIVSISVLFLCLSVKAQDWIAISNNLEKFSTNLERSSSQLIESVSNLKESSYNENPLIIPNPKNQEVTENTTSFLASFFMLIMLSPFIILPCAISGLILWIIGLVHVCKQHELKDRTMWILIILLTGPIGAIVYLLSGRPKKAGALH